MASAPREVATGGCPATPRAASAPPDGNTALLTTTWFTDGTLWAGPVPPYGGEWFAGPEGMKVGWWRAAPGRLSIEGRRLDAAAPPLQAAVLEGYGDVGFQSTTITFPTEGCWEVAARLTPAPGGTAGQAPHSFRIVASVRPASAHPIATPPAAPRG